MIQSHVNITLQTWDKFAKYIYVPFFSSNINLQYIINNARPLFDIVCRREIEVAVMSMQVKAMKRKLKPCQWENSEVQTMWW